MSCDKMEFFENIAFSFTVHGNLHMPVNLTRFFIYFFLNKSSDAAVILIF